MLRRGFLGLLCWTCVLASSLVLIPAGTAFAQSYKVLRRIPVGGEGGWDYVRVDPDAQRIYLSRGTHMMVVDEASGKVDRKSTRLNSSHRCISYAVFCLKKKKK